MRTPDAFLITGMLAATAAVSPPAGAATYSFAPTNFANEILVSATVPGYGGDVTDWVHDENAFDASGRASASFLGSGATAYGRIGFTEVPGPSGFTLGVSLSAGGSSTEFTARADAATGVLDGAFPFPLMLAPGEWTITVGHSTEAPGTPFRVTVSSLLDGNVTAQHGAFISFASSYASWAVLANGSAVMGGGESAVAGVSSRGAAVDFTDSGSYSFLVSDGDSFQLRAAFGIDVERNPSTTASAALNGLINVDITPVPLPPAVWLLASGLLGLVGVARRVAGSRR